MGRNGPFLATFLTTRYGACVAMNHYLFSEILDMVNWILLIYDTEDPFSVSFVNCGLSDHEFP